VELKVNKKFKKIPKENAAGHWPRTSPAESGDGTGLLSDLQKEVRREISFR